VTLPDHVSASQLTTYLTCPRRYRFRYVDKVEPDHEPAELFLGSAVHAGLAHWQTKRIEGEDVGVDVAIDAFREAWVKSLRDEHPRFWDATPEVMEASGEGMVRIFVAAMATLPPPQGVEVAFGVPVILPNGDELPVPLVGFQDYVLADGVVVEVKTTSKKQDPRLAWLLQLAAYAYAQRLTEGKRPTVRVVQLLKGKAPRVDVQDVTLTGDDERWFLEVLGAVYASMQAGAFHPAPSWACLRCGWRRVCRGS
jgi:putative RecB family exonuclease